MGRPRPSPLAGRDWRPLRPVADGQDGDETLVHQSEIDRGPASMPDGAPDVALADPRREERIQADAPHRRLKVGPDVAGRFGVGKMTVTTDPGDTSARCGTVHDLHGPKAAQAASTSSSVAYNPAGDCARPRSVEARSPSPSVSHIAGSAGGAPTGTDGSPSAPDTVLDRDVSMPSRIARRPRRHQT